MSTNLTHPRVMRIRDHVGPRSCPVCGQPVSRRGDARRFCSLACLQQALGLTTDDLAVIGRKQYRVSDHPQLQAIMHRLMEAAQ